MLRSWIFLAPVVASIALFGCSAAPDGTGPDPGPTLDGRTPPAADAGRAGPILGPPQPAGGVLLEADGTIVPFGGVKLDTTNAPSWQGKDTARALAVRIDGSGGWVLAATGEIFAFGKATPISSPLVRLGMDVARAFVVLPDEKSGWVLDADGALHEFGAATKLATGTTAKGLARGVDVHVTNGAVDGGWLLDGYGHVTKFGAAPDLGSPPVYDGYDLWSKLHVVSGGAWAIGRWGIIEPIGMPQGVPLTGLPDTKDADVVRDIVPVSAGGAFDAARALDCPAQGTYCGANGIAGDKSVLYTCPKIGGPPNAQVCAHGCAAMPPGDPDYCHGALSCGHVQWWNTALTYGPYMSYGWWDTDLAVPHDTPVQLRHDSKLYKSGVYGWGYMPEFVDLVTGEKFRFLHLRPQNQLATNVGQVYPAGFVVGTSGGDTADTGLPKYSTGAHLCVQTLAAYRTAFPAGKDPCQ